MEYFIIAFNIMFPLFLLIGLGYLIKISGLVSQQFLTECNHLIFTIFLPFLLFNNMHKADLQKDFNKNIIFFAIGCIIFIFIILCFLIPKIEKRKYKIATIIQGLYRSNFALFGIAIAESMYGIGNAGITNILVAIIVPLFNVLAVCLFEFYRGSTIYFNKIIKSIITNPLIIGTACGLFGKYINILIPYTIQRTIDMIGNLATPTALIVLGGTFSFKQLRKNKRNLLIVLLGSELLPVK